MRQTIILLISVFLMMSCTSGDQEKLHQPNNLSCSSEAVSPDDLNEYVLTKNSTATSKVQVLTQRYESNLVKIISWLPVRWELVAVVKWSAYGNNINILGPIAARVAPAVGVTSNEDAEALAKYNPGTIIRIGPTNYQMAKNAVVKGLNIQEFIGTETELEAVSRVAKEEQMVIDASIYLFDHYGDPWGFEFETAKELQQLVDSVDSRLIKLRGIFTHLVTYSEDTEASLNQQVQKFLSVVCPVAAKIASTLAPEDPSFMVHWGASSELSRLRNPSSGQLELPSVLRQSAEKCLSHPKVNFGIRVGSATYGSQADLPGLQTVLRWTSTITKLNRTPTSTIAVVNVGTEDGYPRFFQRKGDWGVVDIGGKQYPLAAPPEKHQIEIDVGQVPDNNVFVGAEVCLVCDNLSVDNLYQWVAIDSYNIAMCATGACSQFAEATSFMYEEDHPACVGPVTVVSSDEDG